MNVAAGDRGYYCRGGEEDVVGVLVMERASQAAEHEARTQRGGASPFCYGEGGEFHTGNL